MTRPAKKCPADLSKEALATIAEFCEFEASHATMDTRAQITRIFQICENAQKLSTKDQKTAFVKAARSQIAKRALTIIGVHPSQL